MPEYKTPLPGLLARFLEAGINGAVALDTQADKALARLEDRVLEVTLEGIGITLFFSVDEGRFKVLTEYEGSIDTSIRGTPQALFAMAVPDWAESGSGVHIEGDAMLGRDLERFFKRLDPDWEEPLTRVFGDVLGHQLAHGLRQGGRWARQAAQSTGDVVKDYLQEESQVAVHPDAMAEFLDAVDELREASDRLEARIEQIENLELEDVDDGGQA